MGLLKLLTHKTGSSSPDLSQDRLLLYDRYGSIAYGVILQIIPQPELAQNVLVDVFTSPQIQTCLESDKPIAGQIIRLARAKAIACRQSQQLTPLSVSPSNLPELVFDLCFRQGHPPDTVAERLQMPRTDVFRAIRDFFTYLRMS